MNTDAFTALAPDLEQHIAAALNQHALSNRSQLPPFRLPGVARSLVAQLLDSSAQNSEETAFAFGQQLYQQGLGLQSMLAASESSIDVCASSDDACATVRVVAHFFNTLVTGFSAAEIVAIDQQRAETERALVATMEAQREQKDVFRHTISELSTPIVPLYKGILAVPLIGAIDSYRANEITERLLSAITEHQAEVVLVDITGVAVMDTGTTHHLLLTARAANLLGVQMVIVGIGPEIAQTITHMGIELRGVTTLSNLEAGIMYALKQLGCEIVPM